MMAKKSPFPLKKAAAKTAKPGAKKVNPFMATLAAKKAKAKK